MNEPKWLDLTLTKGMARELQEAKEWGEADKTAEAVAKAHAAVADVKAQVDAEAWEVDQWRRLTYAEDGAHHGEVSDAEARVR